MKRFLKVQYLIIPVLILAGLFFLKNRKDVELTPADKAKPVLIDSVQNQEINYKYGFPIDNFQLEEHKVTRNQTLSVILDKQGVSSKLIHEIAQKAKKVFNVRKIRSGKKYAMLFTKDSLRTAEYFIYENTPKEYIVFDLTDTIQVYKGQKEITTVRKQVKGTIESSLWNAMVEVGADPVLSMELSDIYAWTIDFFGIGKGDEFNVIYDEEMIDGKSIHQIKVIAANFVHHKSNNYAFAFDDGDKKGYFDEEGKSLQKAFLKAPLRFSRISSKFSNNRFHPVLKRYRPHHGIDYAAPTGTPVMTIGDGIVVKKGNQSQGGGRYLTIKHNSIYSTTYMHFSRFGKNVGVGARVKQGQVIGYVGASGLATGPHLDFRVHKNGTAINPLKMKSPPVAPVSAQNVVAYNMIKNQLLIELGVEENIAENEVALDSSIMSL
ncbi:metalloendopeptidase [Ancylomarina euxinus]|uniref:Metalloendopeptidase n=1 Tax=Ancylomarina euxinus TaxID=2283627 RepID=A0A425Y0Z7_9BACT|nr:peptidoglycan DD-metalloendopeptidase family protein [Ancylomarina euxinus]MCZ4693771.1 peptidoglycan DD-metalloendopeptidase family protein [Ancylomarina euxinus]MUP15149.1 peptidoglycan DD-metalloendopeptidase family protein [Ancylomarina euxinus]RRG21572.1 metalloendopeptidase [Ancylomarina euxinus]